MTDTRLGTYGCASLTTYVIAKVALLAACGASSYGYEYDGGSSNPLSGSLSLTGAGPALVLGHALARWTAPYLIRTRAYVDEGGPKYKYYSFMLRARSLVGWARVAVAGATALAVAAAVVGVQTACVLFLVVWTFAEAAGRYGEYLLGGVMGDYLGATICIAELLVLAMVVMVQNAQNAGVYASIVKAGGILKSFAEERAGGGGRAAAAAPKKGLSRLFNLFASKPPPRVAAATARAFLRETFVDGDSGARWAAIARFVALLLATYAWCKRVGHPDVFVRANAVAAADAAEEEEEEDDDLDEETALTESEDERDEFSRGRSRTVRAAVAAAVPAASSATPSPSRSSFGAGAFDDATRQSLAGPFAALELHTPPVRRGVAAALAAAAEHANANANANATRVTTETQTLNERESAEVACASPVASFEKRAAAARAYLDALAKPVGSLGTIEAWGVEARGASAHDERQGGRDRVPHLRRGSRHRGVERGGRRELLRVSPIRHAERPGRHREGRRRRVRHRAVQRCVAARRRRRRRGRQLPARRTRRAGVEPEADRRDGVLHAATGDALGDGGPARARRPRRVHSVRPHGDQRRRGVPRGGRHREHDGGVRADLRADGGVAARRVPRRRARGARPRRRRRAE